MDVDEPSELSSLDQRLSSGTRIEVYTSDGANSHLKLTDLKVSLLARVFKVSLQIIAPSAVPVYSVHDFQFL